MSDYSKVPVDLRASNRWLVWKYGEKPNAKGKKPKLPIDLQSGRSVDKTNAACYSFEAVVQANGYEGIGFLPIHPYIGVDLDTCIKDGEVSDFAREVIRHCNSYTEISPSGTGIRIWVRGTAPKAAVDMIRNPMGTNRLVVKDGLIEIYPDAPNTNYLTVTGNAVDGSPLEVRQLEDAEIKQLYAFSTKATASEPKKEASAKGFTRLQRFNMLSGGDWQRLHASQSEADLEYCCFLMEAHSGNKELVEADFRRSKLFRPKWDHMRGSDTYGNNTLKMAFERWEQDPSKGKRKEDKKPLAPLVVVGFDELMQKDIKEREPLLITKGTGATVIYQQSLNQIFASRGVGKTFVSTALAGALAKGEEFLCWKATRPVKVMYVEGELPASQYKTRLHQLVKNVGNDYFKSIILDLQSNNFIPALSHSEGRLLVEEALGDTEYLVLDSVSTLVRIATNEEENWLEFLEWLMKLRSKGLTVMVLQHAGKTGLQRGHSRSEDNLDLSINLKHPEGYATGEGLHCELRFDKVRGHVPDGDEIDVRLEDGLWTYSFLQTERAQKVEDFITQNPGLSDREAGKKLGVSHMTVGRVRRKMHEQGVMLNMEIPLEKPSDTNF